jgi:hypothetical protein
MAIETLNLRLNPQQAIDIMFTPVFTDPNVMEDFLIIKNFYGGEYKLGFADTMKNVVGKAEGCNPKYKGQMRMSERSLWATYVEAGVMQCYEEFLRTNYDYLLPLYTTQNGVPDIQQFLSLITNLLGGGIKIDVSRVAWFGDKTSTDSNLAWANGMFKYLAEMITQGTIGFRVNSSQGTLLTDAQAFALLESVYDNAPAELQNMPAADKKIHISGKLYHQIRRYLRENALSNGFIDIVRNGTEEALTRFENVPVKVHYDWDQISAEYFGLNNQNKIVYTSKNNMVLGTDLRNNAAGSQSSFRVYQNPETDMISVHSKFIFDANYVFEELFSVAL